MAGSLSDFAELEVLDQLFGAAAYTAPVTLYFALFTAAPTDAGGGTECTGGSYARKAVTNNKTNFTTASAGAVSNAAAITFVTATASWGTAVALGVFDASTAGNLIAWCDLTVNKSIASGDTAEIAIGDFDVTLD